MIEKYSADLKYKYVINRQDGYYEIWMQIRDYDPGTNNVFYHDINETKIVYESLDEATKLAEELLHTLSMSKDGKYENTNS